MTEERKQELMQLLEEAMNNLIIRVRFESRTISKEMYCHRKFRPRAQDLCRQSIIKILEDGEFPDWNDLILG